MIDSRYEAYYAMEDNIPCVCFLDLERTNQEPFQQANWHENLEIQWCISGNGYVLLDERRIDFSVGDIIVVNSNIVHYTATESSLKYSCIIIDCNFCKTAGIDHLELMFEPLIKNENIKNIFKEITQIYNDNLDPCHTAKLQLLILKILIELRSNYVISQNKFTIKNSSLTAVKEAIKFIRKNYSKKITLETIAKNVFTDKFMLSRNFKKLTGQTIGQYINIYRCQKAIEFISEGNTIAEAAVKCGYKNMSFFTRNFKKYFGKLPSYYKK